MTDEGKTRKGVRRQRSIYQVHYSLPRRSAEDVATPLLMSPGELQAFGLQVAGHRSTDDKKFTGLLQCNGTVLKPILKESQKREVDFYNRLNTTTNPDLLEMKEFVPKFYGCRKFTYKGYEQDYIILEDLTQRMLEQCVMDVKIGKRTWDPLAPEDKIQREQTKYALSKQQYGFCIPGYQVYKLATGKLLKYGKDYGKKLHGRMVREAIRNYLNGVGLPLCRALVLQLLAALWRVQRWARRQRAVRLYAASLLLVYDATKVRRCCAPTDDGPCNTRCRAGGPPPRRRSVPSLHTSSFSGQLSARGPVYRRLGAGPQPPARPVPPPPPLRSPWSEALDRLAASHSFDHNYEDKLSKIKMEYRSQLDQLSEDAPGPNPWGTVKIIDFAHAFFNEEDEMAVDENFSEGVDNFVQVFEDFLKETEGQV